MELIIVCSLAGLLLSIAIPTVKNTLVTNQLETAARKIIGTVKGIRHKAVRDHKAYLLYFDMEANSWWFEEDGSIDPFSDEPETLQRLAEGIRLSDVTTRQKGMQNSGTVTLWISDKGYMDQTTLHLMDDEGKVLSVLFSPFSGTARVHDGYVEAE